MKANMSQPINILLCMIAALILIAGCASKPYIRMGREATTGIEAGEPICVLLSKYSKGDRSFTWSAEKEEEVEALIREGMSRVNSGLVLVSAQDFRRAALPPGAANDAAISAEAVLQMLSAGGPLGQASSLGVRYLALLKVDTSVSAKRWHTDGEVECDSGGAGIGVYVGKQWTKFSEVEATVLDLKHGRVAGTIGSTSDGKEGAGVAVVAMIFPIPVALPVPVVYGPPTEHRACLGFGKALAQFIAN